MSKKVTLLVVPVLAAVALQVHASQPRPDATLIQDGGLVVDATDFHANILRIPAARRGDFRLSYDRVASVVDNVFIARTFAERARELGLDKDPIIQRRMLQAQEAVLADLYMQKVEKEATEVNLEQRARELYRADPERFKMPEMVDVHHILINLQGRTRAQALERARQIVANVRSGKEDFLQEAARYSDDPQKRKNGGRMGFTVPTAFTEPVAKALAAMKPGEVSDPIESEQGIHVVKLVERKPPQVASFEAVRENIIKVERERLQKERVESLIRDIRSSPTVTVHRQNVEALVIPIDPGAISRALGNASK